MKQKHSSDSHPLPCSYLSAGDMLRLPWCIWHCCSLMASPYIMWLKQPLSFNTSNFLHAHWCWKNVELLWSPKEHNSTTRSASEFKFHRLWFSTASRTHTCGRCAQLCPCLTRLCSSSIPSLDYILIVEMICMPKSHISSLAHTCVFLKASLLPQHLTLKQFTYVMDTREVLVFNVAADGFSPDSWCLWLQRCPTNLTLAHATPLTTSTRYLDCTGKHKQELGTLQTGAASPITQQGELPQAAQGQGWTGTTCHTNPHQCVLLVYSPFLVLFCHSTKCLSGTFEIWELHK